jgi:hypothetical protein
MSVSNSGSSSLAIVISDPVGELVEEQLLECAKISNNIVVSFCDFNLTESIANIIEKYKLDQIVHLVQYEKTDEIEFNPLIQNPEPEKAFWNNISRINGVNLLLTEVCNPTVSIRWILFLNSYEFTTLNFNTFYQNLSPAKCSYIFSDIVLVPLSAFSDDLSIIKILMNENERVGSAKCIEKYEFSETSAPFFDIRKINI